MALHCKHIYKGVNGAFLVRTPDQYVGTFHSSSEATSALATHLGMHRAELPQRQRVCRSGRTSKYQNVFATKVGGFEVRICGKYMGRYVSEGAAATAVRNQLGTVALRKRAKRETRADVVRRFRVLKLIFKD
jgi:hypothetical protein